MQIKSASHNICLPLRSYFSCLHKHHSFLNICIIADTFQGGSLCALLFNLFFNDISHSICTHLVLYADSTYAYSSADHPYTLCKNLYRRIHEVVHSVEHRDKKKAAVYFKKRESYPNRIANHNISW